MKKNTIISSCIAAVLFASLNLFLSTMLHGQDTVGNAGIFDYKLPPNWILNKKHTNDEFLTFSHIVNGEPRYHVRIRQKGTVTRDKKEFDLHLKSLKEKHNNWQDTVDYTENQSSYPVLGMENCHAISYIAPAFNHREFIFHPVIDGMMYDIYVFDKSGKKQELQKEVIDFIGGISLAGPKGAAGDLLSKVEVPDGDVFVVVRAGTKDATLKVANYAKGRQLLDVQTSTEVIDNFVTNGVVEEEKGSLGAFLDVVSPAMSGLEAATHIATGGGAFAGFLGSIFGDFGGKLSSEIATGAGYANLLIAAVQTYNDVTSKGLQKRETGGQVYKNILSNGATISSLVRSPYVNSARAYALNLGFAAVYVYGFTLDSLVNEAKNIRLGTIIDVHKAYFAPASRFYISDERWFGNFRKYYDAAMKNTAETSSAFGAAYDGMKNDIEQYVNGYWMHGQGDIFTVLEAKHKFNYEATADEREYLNHIARKELYERLNKNVLPRIQRFMLTRFSEDAAEALNKMCDPMNKRCRIRVFESQVDEFTERTYAGHVLRFAHNNNGKVTFATGDGWTHTLPNLDEEPRPTNVEMTVLGYLQCGAPNTLLLFKPGTNSGDPASAVRVIPFRMNQQFLEIDIRKNFNQLEIVEKLHGPFNVDKNSDSIKSLEN